MHMADSLLSPVVGLAMCAVSATAIAYSVKKIKRDDLCEKKIPVMGLMGAFVFAAQMLNFAIPATGSSGHIGGGILLAAMIGALPALLSMSAVLIIQCLFFADGGLLALGCNIFNLGVIPCLIIYPLIYKPLINKGIAFNRLAIASIVAVIASLQFGALGVVLQTQISGIAELPFGAFALSMLPIHLAIGITEGIITASVLCSAHKIRPEIMESTLEGRAVKSGIHIRNILIMLAVITVLAGGVLSLFASSYPDGLEWSIEKITGTTELEAKAFIMEQAALIQEAISLMPDYNYKGAGEDGFGTAVAGILGSILTFLFAGILAFAIFFIKKKPEFVTA